MFRLASSLPALLAGLLLPSPADPLAQVSHPLPPPGLLLPLPGPRAAGLVMSVVI